MPTYGSSPGMPVPQPVPWFMSGHYPSWLPSQSTPVYKRDATWQMRPTAGRTFFPSAQPGLEAPMSRAVRQRPPVGMFG